MGILKKMNILKKTTASEYVVFAVYLTRIVYGKMCRYIYIIYIDLRTCGE